MPLDGKSDINGRHWLVDNLPQFLRPYAHLARLDRPIGIWLLFLPGSWAIVMAAGGVQLMNKSDWLVFLYFFCGAVIMRSAGCVVNDLWDKDLDKEVERTRMRPLASGDVGVRGAAIFLLILLGLGLGILLQLNFITILLGVLSLPLIVLYPLMKRWTWWPQAFLGLTFNFGALMGWSAVTGALQLPALLLYVSGILWTLGYDTVYAYQDKEDDTLVGIKSTALKFGANSRLWVGGFYGMSWICLSGAALLSFGHAYVLAFLLPAAAHLFLQLKNWNGDDAVSALRTFKSNRSYGLIVLAGLAISSFI